MGKGIATDSFGVAFFKNLPNGVFLIEVSFIGYSNAKQTVNLPFGNEVLEIELENNEEDNPEVIVTATRTDRSIKNSPTRVEVIAGGEISENISMRPGEIRVLLNESTGIITQQTSAISNTANLRIQELEGKYTQVLRDGFPLYSGLSEGLSLVQIAPLDLKQVEIIKGSSSTLYGGGAIAGLINLVSKTPNDKRELIFLANGTSTGGLDLSAFYSQRFGKYGITLFAAHNSSAPYDPSGTGLTAIPKFRRYSFSPHVFFYGKKTNVNIGLGYITENRLGGNIDFIKYGTPGFFEQNNSNRLTTQFSLTHQLNEHSSLTFKNSYNHFNRSITLPTYEFQGLQQLSFSEISWNQLLSKSQWVTGLNLYTDDFEEKPHSTTSVRNYINSTLGAFVQNTWFANHFLNIETGFRGDYTRPYGFALLPRISLLFNWTDHLSSRLGGGWGYKTPTIFAEESEEIQYRNILPIDPKATKYERSRGVNLDFNYKTKLDDLSVTLNPLFFYTRIKYPLVLDSTAGIKRQFKNAAGYTDSKGLDLSMRFALDKFKFFSGYSYTIAQNHFNRVTTYYPLAPKTRLHFDLVYEKESRLRIALESYYTGKQQLNDGSFGKSYWLIGGLIERSWKHISLFINGEDINNVRQTKWQTIYSGTIDQPTFKDIYAPLDGISINAGIKIKAG
ncbi:MAG: hypothetical protein NVS1B13_20660 [Flavisolibacter sp.]